jgi:hypothetical protein
MTAGYDWQSALDHWKAIEESLPFLLDLVKYVKREMDDAK